MATKCWKKNHKLLLEGDWGFGSGSSGSLLHPSKKKIIKTVLHPCIQTPYRLGMLLNKHTPRQIGPKGEKRLALMQSWLQNFFFLSVFYHQFFPFLILQNSTVTFKNWATLPFHKDFHWKSDILIINIFSGDPCGTSYISDYINHLTPKIHLWGDCKKSIN